jgi:hypothetical protein
MGEKRCAKDIVFLTKRSRHADYFFSLTIVKLPRAKLSYFTFLGHKQWGLCTALKLRPLVFA